MGRKGTKVRKDGFLELYREFIVKVGLLVVKRDLRFAY